MHPADVVVLGIYLVGIVVWGAYLGRSQHTVQDYFVSGRHLPAWAIMGSIVATETSTVTFISVPGLAYASDFTFLQLVIGYLLGRVAVSVLLIPAYFRGSVLTAYQLLGERFGTATRRLASFVFIATRSLADGFRLFATALVLAALLDASGTVTTAVGAWLPGVSPATTLLALSVVVIGLATVFYTYHGGMTAVVWTDVVQLGVYLAGATVAADILLHRIPGGWQEVAAVAGPRGKLRVFDFTWSVTRGFTFWSGVIGGLFLTTATHGTDQLMVQRYLCARSVRDARAALLWSGVVIFAQFALFLAIGTMLFVYYTHYAPSEIGSFTANGIVATDRIFPAFIVHHLPVGLVGLVLAAILAAAMSTLSSSLNSSAAAATNDFSRRWSAGTLSEPARVRVARRWTAAFGVVQVLAALAAVRLSQRVVDEVLAVASFTNGMILGLFLLGTLTRRVRERGALTGAAAGTVVMLAVKLGTSVSWQWYVLIGSVVTFACGWIASRAFGDDVGVPRPA
jgi:solute:Na+ symporter, SSS family